MSLLLVKDNVNSKLRELECDASGNLKVDKVDVSALATESTASAIDAKITACDTSSISGVVSVSAVSGDVACTHASLPLPIGAATENSLSVISGCVTANKLAVESSASVLTVTDAYMWGSSSGPESVLNELDAYSDSVDVSTYDKISIYGSSSNYSDEIEIQVSHNNTNFFELTEKYVAIDYASGQWGLTLDPAFKYIRLKKVGTGMAMMSDDLWALCSGRK